MWLICILWRHYFWQAPNPVDFYRYTAGEVGTTNTDLNEIRSDKFNSIYLSG